MFKPTWSVALYGVLGALVIGFVSGTVVTTRWHAVDKLKAENAALHFDAREAAAKNKEADSDRELIEAADAANQEKIDAAEHILALGYGCPSGSELEWLRRVGESGPRSKPPALPELREAGPSAAAQGCDPWPIIAARERAGRIKANDIITRLVNWYGGLAADFAKGR